MSKRAERKAPEEDSDKLVETSSVLVSADLSPYPPLTRTAHATRISEESTMIDVNQPAREPGGGTSELEARARGCVNSAKEATERFVSRRTCY